MRCLIFLIFPFSLLFLLSDRKATLPGALSEDLDRVSKQAIARQEVSSVALIVGKKDQILKRSFFGKGVNEDTMFDLASLTKVVGTATALCLLLEDNKVKLDDPVKKYVPWWPAPELTVRHLATHTSGFVPYISPFYVKKLFPNLEGHEAVLRAIAQVGPRYPTGKKVVYSCLNYLLLAHVLENAAGETLEALLKRRVWETLGMKSTTWIVKPEDRKRCFPTEGGLRGRVHDPLAALYGTAHGVPGNAGLFSTGPDLALFMAGLACGGKLRGTRVLKTSTVQTLFANQAPRSCDARRALGWVIAEDPKYLPFPGKQSVRFHKGFTGTFLWIDLETGTYIVLLTSRLYPKIGNAEPLRNQVVRIVAKRYLAAD